MSSIPWKFIKLQGGLSWPEAAWGYRRNYFDAADLISMARDKMIDSDNELSFAVARLEAHQLLQIDKVLSDLNLEDTQMRLSGVGEKWLFLNLAWAYETMTSKNDGLRKIERIYADFDYPEAIVGFVAYMPSSADYDPAAHSIEENQSRLIANWRKYLDEQFEIYNKERNRTKHVTRSL